MNFGKRVRFIRQQKEMSQGDLMNRTKFNHSYISRVETGHTIPGLDNMEEFAKGLGVSLYDLIKDDSSSDEPSSFKPPIAKSQRILDSIMCKKCQDRISKILEKINDI